MGLTQVSTSGIKDATVATADIANDAVTFAKMQNTADGVRLLGKHDSGGGQIGEITAAQARTMLNVADGATYSNINGNVDNRVLTATGTSGVSQGEANLTFDGTNVLTVHVPSATGEPCINFTNSDTGTGTGNGFGLGLNESESPYIWNRENTDLRIATNNAERMRIDSLGDVGIGNTDPKATLHINSHKNAETDRHDASNYHLVLRNPEDDTGEACGLGFSITSNATKTGGAILFEREGGGSTGSMQFYTNGDGNSISERMRITAAGKVLIGRTSTSQTHTFQVQSDGNANAVAVMGRSSDDIGELSFFENDASTKLGELQYRQDHLNLRHRVGYMKFATTDSGTLREVASIGSKGHFAIKGNAGSFVSGSSVPTDTTYHQFANTGNGQWCMQLKQEHHNGMNTQLLVNSVTNIEAFQIYSISNNTTRFRVLNNGNCANANNSFGSLSDVKLKENIVDAKSQWNDVKAVKVRNFNFKNDKDSKLLGVVAQEVESVSSGLVFDTIDRDPNDSTKEIGTTKNVKYSILYMKAFKALQEAMARIEALEAKVA